LVTYSWKLVVLVETENIKENKLNKESKLGVCKFGLIVQNSLVLVTVFYCKTYQWLEFSESPLFPCWFKDK